MEGDRKRELVLKQRKYEKKWAKKNKERITSYNKAWVSRNKKKVAAYQKKWNSKNKDKLKKNFNIWLAKNKEKAATYRRLYGFKNRKKLNLAQRKRELKVKYSLSWDAYQQLLKLQNNCCAICCKTFTKKNGPQVDHCHVTKKVRGLLHKNCNLILGHAKDNPQILQQASNYLLV